MKNTKENNKLIAKFMGYDKKSYLTKEDYIYHNSWDWLMPVIEKIENSKECFSFEIKESFVFISSNGHNFIHHWNYSEYSSKIEAVYMAVIDFIKWYNDENI